MSNIRPAITDNGSAAFDSVPNNIDQGVNGSARSGNEKRFSRLALNTAKHPLPLNRVAPMIFAPTELAVVYFDGLLRTADLLRAALQVHQHGFSAELAPVCDGSVAEAMLSLGNVGRYAVHDVVCEKHNVITS